MRGWKLAAVAFGTAVVMCAALFIVVNVLDNASNAKAVSLWYIEGDCSASALEKLTKEYNRNAGINGMKLELRSFPDEEQLGAAFNEDRPELLLCSNSKAEDLAERGQLSTLQSEGISFSKAVLEAAPSAGSSFFPLGAKVELLVLNNELMAESGIAVAFSSLEELTAKGRDYFDAKGSAFFSACSYADMLRALMCSVSAPFSCDLKTDAKNPSFHDIYNLLADCGYHGGLISLGRESARYVEQGLLPCACVCSDELNALKGKNLSVTPLPMPKDGKPVCQGELMGFAVIAPEAEKEERARHFVRWLWEKDRSNALALNSALLPLAMPEDGSQLWQPAMAEILSSYDVSYYPIDSDLAEKRTEFDRVFAQTLDLLQ